MKKYTISNVISSFSVKPNESISMLLGAGASISSGIMSGGQMVWDFKRKIYCIENRISETAFPDMSKETAQREIQTYLDATREHPSLYSREEYSHYFEYLFGNKRDRDLYIQSKVKNVTPYLGYLCLGALIIEGRIKFLNTTNFDDLIKAGVYAIDAGHSIKTISSAIENSVGFNLNDDIPTILKLHGDYLVDHLKNTSEELQALENSINLKLQDVLHERGLIVIGYAGNDNSVMTVLEKIVNQNGLPYGIIWCKPKNTVLSERAENFMEFACSANEQSGVVDIDSFDDLMYRLYLTMGKSYKEIDERWKNPDCIKPILFGGLRKRNVFTKTNTFEALKYPEESYAFETTITSWKELRSYLNHSGKLVAALFKGKVWAFGDKEEIQNIFEKVLKSDIEMQKFPEDWIQKDYSFVWSLYYDLIKVGLISQGLICFGRNKFFDPKESKKENGNIIYDAVEVFLSCVGKKILLTILPTFYIEKDNGQPIDKLHKQRIINFHSSKLYNLDVSQRINDWTKRLCFNKELAFRIAGFLLEFNKIVYTGGGVGRKESWTEIQCFQCEEPKMCFSIDDDSKVAINQLKGLINYGPIEYLKNGTILNSIKLAALTPAQTQQEIVAHLEKLKQQYVTNLKQERYFLPEYLGFEKIFGKDIDIPSINDNVRFMSYNLDVVLKLDAINFFKGLTRYINVLAKNLMSFDILIIYIPSCLAHLREIKNESAYFDLHDSLKLYCADKGIVVQLIEGKSAIPDKNNDTAKIMWGLSTGLYSKAVGRLWKPAVYPGFSELT